MRRVRYGAERIVQDAWPDRCRDCACLDGELHMRGCCLEQCPACGGQYWGGACPCLRLDRRLLRLLVAAGASRSEQR